MRQSQTSASLRVQVVKHNLPTATPILHSSYMYRLSQKTGQNGATDPSYSRRMELAAPLACANFTTRTPSACGSSLLPDVPLSCTGGVVWVVQRVVPESCKKHLCPADMATYRVLLYMSASLGLALRSDSSEWLWKVRCPPGCTGLLL